MKEVLSDIERWRARGEKFALATVIEHPDPGGVIALFFVEGIDGRPRVSDGGAVDRAVVGELDPALDRARGGAAEGARRGASPRSADGPEGKGVRKGEARRSSKEAASPP